MIFNFDAFTDSTSKINQSIVRLTFQSLVGTMNSEENGNLSKKTVNSGPQFTIWFMNSFGNFYNFITRENIYLA